MKLYTIGFTQKSAEQFFGLLEKNGIQRLVDIRINPQGQLSGFAKKEDLPYFLDELVNHCHYVYLPLLAPTKELLQLYRSNRNWNEYVKEFEELMDIRQVPDILDKNEFENLLSCLLCSEPTPEKCHRKLVADRLATHWPNVEVIHL